MNELIKICPFCIMMFKNYYNLYYNNEELKSIEIGNLTLRIVEDMVKESYNVTYKYDDEYIFRGESLFCSINFVHIKMTFF